MNGYQSSFTYADLDEIIKSTKPNPTFPPVLLGVDFLGKRYDVFVYRVHFTNATLITTIKQFEKWVGHTELGKKVLTMMEYFESISHE